MAVTLTADLTEIDDCDVIDNWTSNEATAVDTGIYREGAGSVGIEKVSQEMSYAQYDYYTDHSNTYLDIAGETHIYFWAQTAGTFDTWANGGLRLRLTDSGGNYEEWWVGGYDNYYGGFQNYVCYTGTTPDDSSGSLIHNEIRYITIYFKITSKTVVGENNCWVDILYYGDGLLVKGGTSGDKGTFDEIIAADVTPAYGVLAKKFGAFVAQGPITFGDSSGATTTYFSDSNEIVLFADALVSSTHYAINVVGNSTGTNSVQFGSVTGSGSLMVGSDGIIIKSVNASLPYSFTAANVDVDELFLYGNSFINTSNVYLGTSSTILGSAGTTVNLVDNSFSNPTQVFRNISSSATITPLRNKIVSANDARGSMDLYDGIATTSDEWSIIEGAGYEDSAGGATTISITGEAFPNTTANKPYLSITDSTQTFNLNNVGDGAGSRITVGSNQDEFAFDDTGSPWVGSVNENFIVTWKVEEPDGTDILNARVKIIETAPSVAIANQDSSDATGDASSTYLRANYVPSGTTTITTTIHTPAAYKAYRYGYIPTVSSATIDAAVSKGVTLLDDDYQVEAVEATAVADGTLKVTFNEATEEHSIIKVTSIATAAFSIGDTVTGAISTASGVIEDILEGDGSIGTDATLLLDGRNGNAFNSDGEIINDSTSGGSATESVTHAEQRFHWIIQAGTISGTARNMQQLYDHFQAKLGEATLDATDGWDDVALEGRAEYANPIQGVSLGSPNTFKTIRNVALTRGWAVSGLSDLGAVSSFTDNAGAAFSPESTVDLVIQGVKTGDEPANYVRVRIHKASDESTIMNTQATTSYGAEGYYKASTTYKYTGDVAVIVRARYNGYLPFEASATITSSGLTVTAVWQTDPNFTP